MRILGIDPGYATIGWGVLDYSSPRFTPVEYGAIITPAGDPFDARLEQIYNELTAIIERCRPDSMSIERLFFAANRTTGIDVAQARGVLLLCARQHGVEAFEYTPLQVKQAVVGYGKAEKHQVMDMTRRILNLRETPKPDDTADALALAICHGHSGGHTLQSLLLRRSSR